jgi:hypothetical protein
MMSHPWKPNSREKLGTVDVLCLISVFSKNKPPASAASIDCLSLASLSIIVQWNVLAYLGSFVSYKELKCCEEFKWLQWMSHTMNSLVVTRNQWLNLLSNLTFFI